MMRSIVLTGATSMIGIALVKQCVQNNVRVLALIRNDSLRLNAIPKSDLITTINCDLGNLVEFDDEAPFPVDVFYHLGWSDTDKQGRKSCNKQLQNVAYTLDAVRLAKKLGCKRFIGIGSQAEYGLYSNPVNSFTPVNPIDAYGTAKYTAKKLSKIECTNFNIEHIWVCVFYVYGTESKGDDLIKSFIVNCKSNKPIGLSPCTHIWDFLYEDDAGRALFMLGEQRKFGKTYFLGSGTGRPLKEYLEEIKSIVNPEYVPGYGKIPYTGESTRYLCADITELSNDTGWKPEVLFKDGIRSILASLRRKI
ncbi:CDP-abequose synthase [Spirochaetia bacterium]|nr:CDP-abequose synthase [Spirochaetia bacterium]